MNFSVFYTSGNGMLIKARDAHAAKAKAITILQEKFPARRIRECDLVVNY